ncbi:hypothetical protein SAMN06265373_101100 [Shimia sagamensis]|uniref:Uncharacterized protein n=2 Tax=Shimia sagamensis TaxID=1566352 RepID=A0ABY1N6R4_9RHOB|nr:hypothetical protein SAMN06265373_101100 [Shimia sagamensis]
MARSGDKKPLYRRVNTRTHGVRHGCLRLDHREKRTQTPRTSMRQGLRHGVDHTPLFRFLLSKVGQSWDAVYSEAQSRLLDEAPIWWLVARSELDRQDVVRVGESSYFSGLYVADTGQLEKVAPHLTASDMRPDCPCCTHTFNGEPFGLPFALP